MNVTLTQKDWLLISAYLDGRLNAAAKASFDLRLEKEIELKTALHEIDYTRRMLRSLPQKRAPRNFTLSAQYEKKASRKWGLNRYFGFASAASAVALVAIFAWTSLFSFSAKTAAPAPMMAALPEAALDSAETTSSAPMIITWGTQPGRGGGGGADTAALATGMGGGYGGGAPEVAQGNILQPTPTEIPQPSAKVAATASADETMAATPDPSTLILGLPAPGTEGQTISESALESAPSSAHLPASVIWMISLGSVTLIFAVLAILLRRR